MVKVIFQKNGIFSLIKLIITIAISLEIINLTK